MKKKSNSKKSKKKKQIAGNYPINISSNIPPELQSNSPMNKLPEPPHNGGLYSGAPFNGPWGNIPVSPTTDSMINKNLVSSKPPPRSTTQYPLNVRPGNNYQAMSGIQWYKPDNKGPFKLQVQSGGKKNNKKTKSKKSKKKTKSKKSKKGGNRDYSVNIDSVVPITKQWNNPNQSAPEPPHNGGLYTGPNFNGPWKNYPVTPTSASMMENMKSANPPPGADLQTTNKNRPGNNYSGMKINWYNPSNGPFKMQVVSKGGSSKINKKIKKNK